MYTTDYESKLKELLEHAKGKKKDVAAKVYEIILESDDQVELFEWFLKNVGDINSTQECEIEPQISEEDFKKLSQSCNTMVAGLLENLLSENLPEEEFYKSLWERVFQSDTILQKKEQKIYALFRIWNDPRIPYFEMESGLKMDNDIFKHIVESKKQEIKKARFILNSVFEQRTEYSSLLLKLLDEECQNEERAVVLAIILALVENTSENRGRREERKLLDKEREEASSF